MKIAIIGAGLAGLAIVHALLDAGESGEDIHLYDSKGIAAGASGAAAGVLHAYAGARARRNWQADASMPAAMALIERAEAAMPGRVISARGLLRLALQPQQLKSFQVCAESYEDVEWWSEGRCQAEVPGLTRAPGIFIQSALAVHIPNYLGALWSLAKNKGVELHIKQIQSLAQLDNYARIYVAGGAASISIDECAGLPLFPVKGQLLELKWPKELAPLPFAVNSSGYIVQHDPGRCLVGSTFEHEFDSPDADPVFAENFIRPKIEALLPELAGAEILRTYAGIRASSPGHRPIIQQLNAKTWLVAGLGSKGLLHHAWAAKQIPIPQTES